MRMKYTNKFQRDSRLKAGSSTKTENTDNIKQNLTNTYI